METIILLISSYIENFTYLAIFILLLLCGLGLPLPEDIILITGGFLAYEKYANINIVLAVALIGVLSGDTFIYMIGRHLGRNIIKTKFFRRIISKKKMRKFERYYEKYGEKTIFIARFLPGLRAPIFALSGVSKMKYSKFIFYDGFAAIISVPLFVYLAYYFGEDIEHILKLIKRTEIGISIAGIIAIGFIIYKFLNKRK